MEKLSLGDLVGKPYGTHISSFSVLDTGHVCLMMTA